MPISSIFKGGAGLNFASSSCTSKGGLSLSPLSKYPASSCCVFFAPCDAAFASCRAPFVPRNVSFTPRGVPSKFFCTSISGAIPSRLVSSKFCSPNSCFCDMFCASAKPCSALSLDSPSISSPSCSLLSPKLGISSKSIFTPEIRVLAELSFKLTPLFCASLKF